MSSTSRISLEKSAIDKAKLLQPTQLQWPHSGHPTQQNTLNVANNFVSIRSTGERVNTQNAGKPFGITGPHSYMKISTENPTRTIIVSTPSTSTVYPQHTASPSPIILSSQFAAGGAMVQNPHIVNATPGGSLIRAGQLVTPVSSHCGQTISTQSGQGLQQVQQQNLQRGHTYPIVTTTNTAYSPSPLNSTSSNKPTVTPYRPAPAPASPIVSSTTLHGVVLPSVGVVSSSATIHLNNTKPQPRPMLPSHRSTDHNNDRGGIHQHTNLLTQHQQHPHGLHLNPSSHQQHHQQNTSSSSSQHHHGGAGGGGGTSMSAQVITPSATPANIQLATKNTASAQHLPSPTASPAPSTPTPASPAPNVGSTNSPVLAVHNTATHNVHPTNNTTTTASNAPNNNSPGAVSGPGGHSITALDGNRVILGSHRQHSAVIRTTYRPVHNNYTNNSIRHGNIIHHGHPNVATIVNSPKLVVRPSNITNITSHGQQKIITSSAQVLTSTGQASLTRFHKVIPSGQQNSATAAASSSAATSKVLRGQAMPIIHSGHQMTIQGVTANATIKTASVTNMNISHQSIPRFQQKVLSSLINPVVSNSNSTSNTKSAKITATRPQKNSQITNIKHNIVNIQQNTSQPIISPQNSSNIYLPHRLNTNHTSTSHNKANIVTSENISNITNLNSASCGTVVISAVHANSTSMSTMYPAASPSSVVVQGSTAGLARSGVVVNQNQITVKQNATINPLTQITQVGAIQGGVVIASGTQRNILNTGTTYDLVLQPGTGQQVVNDKTPQEASKPKASEPPLSSPRPSILRKRNNEGNIIGKKNIVCLKDPNVNMLTPTISALSTIVPPSPSGNSATPISATSLHKLPSSPHHPQQQALHHQLIHSIPTPRTIVSPHCHQLPHAAPIATVTHLAANAQPLISNNLPHPVHTVHPTTLAVSPVTVHHAINIIDQMPQSASIVTKVTNLDSSRLIAAPTSSSTTVPTTLNPVTGFTTPPVPPPLPTVVSFCPVPMPPPPPPPPPGHHPNRPIAGPTHSSSNPATMIPVNPALIPSTMTTMNPAHPTLVSGSRVNPTPVTTLVGLPVIAQASHLPEAKETAPSTLSVPGHMDDLIPTSPRKKPRKQLLNASTDFMDDENKDKANLVGDNQVEVKPVFTKDLKVQPKSISQIKMVKPLPVKPVASAPVVIKKVAEVKIEQEEEERREAGEGAGGGEDVKPVVEAPEVVVKEESIMPAFQDDYTDANGVKWTNSKVRLARTLMCANDVKWKPKLNHFKRHSDVIVKEERRTTINELANQNKINQKISGWKLFHSSAQFDEAVTSEKDLFSFLDVTSRNLSSDYIPKLSGGLALTAYQHNYPHDNEANNTATLAPSPYSNHNHNKRSPYHKHSLEDDIEMIHEIAKRNMQRSKLFIEQITEAKTSLLSILDHKPRIQELVNKYHSKRLVKKKERL